MGSIGTLMGLDIRVPDYSTLSRRANGLSIAQAMRQAGSVAVHLVVDSTGLKIFGEGEWLAQKHKIKGIRRRWRKLHLGLDLASGAIVCADLTHDEVGDSTALPGLLDQLDALVTGFLADGAYDGASIRDMLRQRYGETLDVVIPPPKNAVIRPQSARDPTVRDRHIAQIRSNGRMAWQVATGYNQRSRIETQIGSLEERDRPQAQISQLPQANHGDPDRPESSEHNDRTRAACVRTHRLTLPLGNGRIPSPPRSMQQRCFSESRRSTADPASRPRRCRFRLIRISPPIFPPEEIRDFQSFIQTALDGLTASAGGEVMALGTGMFTGLALIVVVIAGVKIAFSGNIQPWELVRLVIGIWIPWVMLQFYTNTIPGMSQTFPGMIAEGGNFLHQMLLGDIISSMQTELGDMVRAIAANMQTQAAQGNVIGILTGGVHAFITAVAGSIIMALLVLMLIVLFAVTYAQVIWAQIALAILIILGPIFIPFLVFEPLAFLFWGWFKGMLTYSLYAVIAGCVLRVFSAVGIAYITTLGGANLDTQSMTQVGLWTLAVIPLFIADLAPKTSPS